MVSAVRERAGVREQGKIEQGVEGLQPLLLAALMVLLSLFERPKEVQRSTMN